VSVGVVEVLPDCHLTGPEILDAAARAKKFAKEGGRNCVATYSDSFFEDGGLRIIKTKPHI